MRGEEVVAPDGGTLEHYSSGLGVVAYVLAARDIDLDAAPEEGDHEQRAKALDRADATEKAARTAEKQADQVEDDLSKIEDPDDETVEAARQVRRQAERARDNADRARLEADEENP
jgi:hypothetical protein